MLEDSLVSNKADLIRHLFVAWMAGGHVLIEGPPGTGKTITALRFSQLLGRAFKRIQFTSDMLPSDILGANIYSPKDNNFQFRPGPLFTDIVLADEINRAPPRTQSALLEAMEERQITIEGETRNLDHHFFVIATQNAIEFEGTFPLPEAQIDRFLFKIELDHYPAKEEIRIMELGLQNFKEKNLSQIMFNHADMLEECQSVKISPAIFSYTAILLEKTRHHETIDLGASVRAGLSLLKSSRVLALIEGRDFVTADDIKELSLPVLRHRLRLTPEAQMNGLRSDQVINDLLQQLEFPK